MCLKDQQGGHEAEAEGKLDKVVEAKNEQGLEHDDAVGSCRALLVLVGPVGFYYQRHRQTWKVLSKEKVSYDSIFKVSLAARWRTSIN